MSLRVHNGACACAVVGERGTGGRQGLVRGRPQEVGMVTDDAVGVLGSGLQAQICPWGRWPGPWRPSRAPASSLLISLPEAFFLTGKLHIDSAHPGSQPTWWEGWTAMSKTAVEWGGAQCYKESPASWQPQSLF